LSTSGISMVEVTSKEYVAAISRLYKVRVYRRVAGGISYEGDDPRPP
jgi:hypothetical protein